MSPLLTGAMRRFCLFVPAVVLVSCSPSPASSSTLPPLQGNGRSMPLPSDAPAEVRSLPALFSCGAETFEDEGDEGDHSAASEPQGASEAPGASAPAEDESSDPGATCLIGAVDRREPAQYVVASGDQDAGGRLTIYRVTDDGRITLYVRLAPSFATPETWTRLVCTGLSLSDEGIVEDGCTTPVTIR